MKFAILAAGEGSRLASEGVAKPKPLVELQGVPLIERLIRIFARNGASSINIIVNEQQPETVEFIKSIEVGCPINIVIKSTPSSMHSMHALSHLLRGEKFCLTTVDTLFREDEFANYIKKFEEYEGDGIMAVTDYIDDEKPLYIATDENMEITAFCDKPTPETHYISGGIYGLSPKALDILDRCMNDGIHRMRNFQRRLV
ncbi:MAG: NTP transferase domain-containing protein, partial [Bacteroidaceae bacterium]|nr:NTP transferase domain-containing protein [Bacteroidaceae bacterium]